MCEVAWSLTRVRDSYLATWYWKVKQRRGTKKAIVALARKLLVIIYNMLKNGTDYDEKVFYEVRKKQETIRVKRLINEAKKLGLEVIVPQSV
ncbi:hypothetical protein Csac_2716 [Caldicellulosiruptor saccharolyticus DSM 8903]|uniref:Transposase IS116/IS110/IS902 family protein n=1 Tax=Caldicellulosiruptor saccharolyticus (strain ATCC 43494 / DSM 8903 / Tp8T 6331) TaxID=351627 RepID=A4XN00_CALS8|nr:hypothetical protein Csac_2716 [Caldicellulosiruptor saccharolyticus DSM 8903]